MMKDGKLEYMQMIQEPIGRMSTASAVFKGFSATIVAGISVISYSDIKSWILGLSFLPVFAFLLLDIYYLKLERGYRYLFEQVRTDKHKIDYSLQILKDSQEVTKAKARVMDCIKSPSIYLFYPLMLGILISVFVLKCLSVI